MLRLGRGDNGLLEPLLWIITIGLNIGGSISQDLPYLYNLCLASVHENTHQSIGSGNYGYFREGYPLAAAIDNPGCIDQAKTGANTLSVHVIKYKSEDIVDQNNILFGWLHLKLDVAENGFQSFVMTSWVFNKSSGSQLQWGYVPGEFPATNFNTECKETFGPGVGNFKKKHIAPCLYAADPANLVPSGIAYYSSDSTKSLKKAQFNWRSEFPDCGHLHEKQSFDFRIFGNHVNNPGYNGCSPGGLSVNQSGIFMSNNVYGGYDPEPPRGSATVECGSALISNGSKNLPPWIKDLDSSPVPPDKAHANCRISATKPYGDIQYFEGRCNTYMGVWSVSDLYPITCKNWSDDRVSYPDFKPGVRPETGCEGCDIERNKTMKWGVTASSRIGRYIWAMRTTHGMAMAISTMFLLPVSSLLARYFKETCMASRAVNVHVWHGMHISLSIMAFGGLFSGVVAGIIGRLYFGYSWHMIAIVHVILGWASLFLFLIPIFTGPWRIFPMAPRKISICFHFTLGTIPRVLWIICLLTSFYISSSPAAAFDIHKDGFHLELGMFIVLGLVAVDLGVHILLQVQLILQPNPKKFHRKYAALVPIPILRPYMEQDAAGSPVRCIALSVLAVVGFASAILLTAIMCFRNPTGRYFGKMGYTHKTNGKLNSEFQDLFYKDDDG